MECLVDLLFNRDAVLRQRDHKRLTRAHTAARDGAIRQLHLLGNQIE